MISSKVIFLLLTLFSLVSVSCGSGDSDDDDPQDPGFQGLDLRDFDTDDGLSIVYGAAGEGRFGVPVAGGVDCDGDGFPDYAMAAMRASPFNRPFAGEVNLVSGDGTVGQSVDTGLVSPAYLIIAGAAARETTGASIWIDDVTGDGRGDLLIGRQNYRAATPDRRGAGALTIVAGGPQLAALAARREVLDLDDPPATVDVFTIIGAEAFDRLGIWVRSGDITGDGINDLVIGADQEDGGGEDNRGAAYVVRGGSHLATSAVVDLTDFGSTRLAGRIARLVPPSGADGFHFGATVALADLDDNGRSEILVAVALNRLSAGLAAQGAAASTAESRGGRPRGRLYIAWDDNFAGAWPAGLTITLNNTAPGSVSVLDGGVESGVYANEFFGEAILGGLDYNGDGEADLFVGDLGGDVLPGRADAGLGHIFFSARDLKNRSFAVNAPPAGLRVTTLLGAQPGAGTGDTALHGDFDADGIADLAVAAPLASPQGREGAGVVHVLWGRAGTWPQQVDLLPRRRPGSSTLRITDILGARGLRGNDVGDTLGHSAAAADLDRDGYTDLIVSEMLGNGTTAGAVDVGNLLVISGAALARFK